MKKTLGEGRIGALKTVARKGDAVACAQLSGLYEANAEPRKALHWLRRAATGGDVTATTRLGLWHLVGHHVAMDSAGGFRLVRRAADTGSDLALVLLATLHAGGIGTAASFGRAVDCLIGAARRGNGRALGQLGFLLPEGEDFTTLRLALLRAAAIRGDRMASRLLADGPPPLETGKALDWGRVREAAAAPGLTVSAKLDWRRKAPRIATSGRVLGDRICDYLIAAAGPYLQPATVNDAYRGEEIRDASRSNRAMGFWPVESDVVIESVNRALAGLIGLAPETGEAAGILHYVPGQSYAPHHDYCDPALPVHVRQIAARGQRIASLLVYLNDDYEGGETRFPALDWQFRGQRGEALAFYNVSESGAIDPATLHTGMPPTAGEKWLLSKWFRDRPRQ